MRLLRCSTVAVSSLTIFLIMGGVAPWANATHVAGHRRAGVQPKVNCSKGFKYAGDSANNAANEGVYGDIRAEGETYGGTSSNHMAAWLGSNTPQDDTGHGIFDNEDWIQGGYMIGSADGQDAQSQVMYQEHNDAFSGGSPILVQYPQYGLGNQFFESSITSQTSNGRGLYDMFRGTTLIGAAWLIDPTNTYQQAVMESYDTGGNACPVMNDGLFGTTGSNDSFSSSTKIYIIQHGFSPNPWGTQISTDTLEQGDYNAAWWSDYSAFQTFGPG